MVERCERIQQVKRARWELFPYPTDHCRLFASLAMFGAPASYGQPQTRSKVVFGAPAELVVLAQPSERSPPTHLIARPVQSATSRSTIPRSSLSRCAVALSLALPSPHRAHHSPHPLRAGLQLCRPRRLVPVRAHLPLYPSRELHADYHGTHPASSLTTRPASPKALASASTATPTRPRRPSATSRASRSAAAASASTLPTRTTRRRASASAAGHLAQVVGPWAERDRRGTEARMAAEDREQEGQEGTTGTSLLVVVAEAARRLSEEPAVRPLLRPSSRRPRPEGTTSRPPFRARRARGRCRRACLSSRASRRRTRSPRRLERWHLGSCSTS